MLLFCGYGELREHPAPHALQVLTESFQPRRVGAIEVARPRPLVGDELGVAQDGEVLGDRRPADGNLAGQLRDGLRSVAEQLENRAPRRVCQSDESLLVSVH